jgi:hypothetical protein
VPFESVRLLQGDSDELIAGGGTGGSKSLMASGAAIIEASALVVVSAVAADCCVQFDPVGKAKFTSSCVIDKAFLAKSAVNYSNAVAPAGTPATVKIGETVIPSYTTTGLDAAAVAAKAAEFSTATFQALKAATYPVSEKKEKVKAADGTETEKTTYAMAGADPAGMNKPMLVVFLTLLVILVTMVYGPIAAVLVELFPTRIRYTAMSLPYHIGNGWFGGLLPFIAFAMVAAQGDIYYGLWYPIVIAAATVVIGLIFVPETKDVDIYLDD